MKNALIAASVLAVVVLLGVGVALKSRNDARHVEQMRRQAEAQEKIAAAVPRVFTKQELVEAVDGQKWMINPYTTVWEKTPSGNYREVWEVWSGIGTDGMPAVFPKGCEKVTPKDIVCSSEAIR